MRGDGSEADSNMYFGRMYSCNVTYMQMKQDFNTGLSVGGNEIVSFKVLIG